MDVAFGPFRFNTATREVRRDGGLVHLSPKAFDLLSLLLQCSPNALSKSDIHRALWPDSFVSDGAVAVLVAEIRRALGDSAKHSPYVRTVSRFGYAFAGPLLDQTRLPRPDRAPAAYWIVHGEQRHRLRAGQNILGRDPDADVVIDAVGVSRRHAALDVAKAMVALRDLSSKNGTFLDGVRVTAPVLLADHAEVRLGAVNLQFRRAPVASTATQTVDTPRDGREPA